MCLPPSPNSIAFPRLTVCTCRPEFVSLACHIHHDSSRVRCGKPAAMGHNRAGTRRGRGGQWGRLRGSSMLIACLVAFASVGIVSTGESRGTGTPVAGWRSGGGAVHTCGIRSNGTACGAGASPGLLGDGENRPLTPRPLPVHVAARYDVAHPCRPARITRAPSEATRRCGAGGRTVAAGWATVRRRTARQPVQVGRPAPTGSPFSAGYAHTCANGARTRRSGVGAPNRRR